LKVVFPCPICNLPSRVDTAPGAAPVDWQCRGCDHRLQVQPPADAAAPAVCLVCGNHELYKQKDFPHWLGLAILAVACVGFLVGHGIYRPWLGWSILLVSAAIDALLYWWVGDAVVCYRCNAHFRAVPPRPEHLPHELIVAERYRQERLRREQLR
jgi:hypothetical protein